jgi:hypothetical protein
MHRISCAPSGAGKTLIKSGVLFYVIDLYDLLKRLILQQSDKSPYGQGS